MDLFVKSIILCVIISYVFADRGVGLDLDLNNTLLLAPQNYTDEVERNAVKLRKYIVECTEETKVNPEMILKLRTGKWRQALRKNPPALKKWSLCLLVKFGMMSLDGVLKQDVVLASIPPKDRVKVEKVIDKCLYKKRHSPIDIAWHYIVCFRSKYAKYSLI